MRVSDLELHDVTIGLRVKSLISDKWGTIIDIDFSDDYYCYILWDGDEIAKTGFYGNKCECEIDETSIRPWNKFDKSYKKEKCFVKLKDGKVYGPCWPNAGMFHVLYINQDRKEISDNEVESIKYLE